MNWSVGELFLHCPRLRSLRFTLSNTLEEEVEEEDLGARLQKLSAHPEPRSNFSPPRKLHSQPLERHGEGFRLGWRETDCCE
jgi:hypothetical protein